MTTRTIVWKRSPPETAKVYTVIFTQTNDGVTSPINLDGATVKLVCSLFDGGFIDITDGVRSPATDGIADVSLSSSQLTRAAPGKADAHYEITLADSTVRHVPEDGATFPLILS